MVLKNFIVIEGIDGSGTSTQLKKLKIEFSKQQIATFFTCEPTDSEIGKLIRKVLKGEIKLSPQALASLFSADRTEHIYGENGIIKAHNDGKIVISDRYHFSTLAYQSTQLDMDLLFNQNKEFPLPSKLFFLDTSPEIADKRVDDRACREIYGKLEIQKEIRQNYFKTFEYFNDKNMEIIVIDGSYSIEETTKAIMDELKSYFV